MLVSIRLARPSAATLCLLSVSMLLGCSSSDDSSGSTPSLEPSPAFSSYCFGTLLTDRDLMESQPPGWVSDGTQGSAPAGTTFVVGASFDRWEGYILPAGQPPMKLNADFNAGLVKDTDFTSDCATDDKKQGLGNPDVLLADAAFYSNQDLTGEPCVLTAGTELNNLSFYSVDSSVASDEIQSQCGLTTAYSNDIAYGSLIRK